MSADSAIEKINRAANGDTYNIYLDSYEYYDLLNRAYSPGSAGQSARDALATCKTLNWKPFSLLSYRDTAKEESYASMGTSSTSSGGCFLTSACMAHIQEEFDDDCYELTVLRNFRDSWLRKHHLTEIFQYYKEAPRIVRILDALQDSGEVYEDIYDTGILPAVKAIEEEDYSEAYSIYRGMFEGLKERFGKKAAPEDQP